MLTRIQSMNFVKIIYTGAKIIPKPTPALDYFAALRLTHRQTSADSQTRYKVSNMFPRLSLRDDKPQEPG